MLLLGNTDLPIILKAGFRVGLESAILNKLLARISGSSLLCWESHKAALPNEAHPSDYPRASTFSRGKSSRGSLRSRNAMCVSNS